MAAAGGEVVQAGALLRGGALPPAESRALLCSVLGMSRETLIAHPETAVTPEQRERFDAAVAQRSAGMPLAYLLGEQEFYGYRFRVSPAVLVPRPETELLVDTALAIVRGKRAARVLELGTGSGCVAIALGLRQPGLFIVASDASPDALCLARENRLRLGATVHLVAGHWYAPLRGRFDLIVSNPPYIAAGDAHLEDLRHEPYCALSDGGDGLGALRAIIGGATGFLAPGGDLLVEHGHDQGAAVRTLMLDSGLRSVRTLGDLAGHERVCWGQAPGA